MEMSLKVFIIITIIQDIALTVGEKAEILAIIAKIADIALLPMDTANA